MFVVEVKNGVVYEFLYEDNLLIQERALCAFVSLVIEAVDETTIDTATPVKVLYKDYEGNPLPDETEDIYVSVKVDDEEVGTITLTPVDGEASFDFIPSGTGEHVIEAFCNKSCNIGKKVVSVIDAKD